MCLYKRPRQYSELLQTSTQSGSHQAVSINMKAFILAVVLFGLAAAQESTGRTRPCGENEFPGKRVARQAPPQEEAPKPCWFVPDDTIQNGEDCQKAFESGTKCEQSQVFVKLGQLKVCIKFEAADRWFLSEGTNGHCGTSECCEWYPKETSKVVFCVVERPLLKWFPLTSSCEDAEAKDTANVGVEIIPGQAGETKSVCIGKPAENGTDVTEYHKVDVKLTPKCGGGCCIFEFADVPKEN